MLNVLGWSWVRNKNTTLNYSLTNTVHSINYLHVLWLVALSYTCGFGVYTQNINLYAKNFQFFKYYVRSGRLIV